MDTYDAIIVGFGLAGATTAYCLARSGLRVLAVDLHETLPATMKGELLQPGGVRTLERLGLAHCLDSAGVGSVRVDGYAVMPAASSAECSPGAVLLRYPPRDPAGLYEQLVGVRARASDAPARAPKGRSFHNARLVAALRSEALRAGAVCAWGECRGVEVEGGRAVGVAWAPRGEAAALRHPRAPLVIVCNGMFSQLRGAGAPAAETLSLMAGLLLRHAPGAPPLPHANHGHVVLVSPSPVLFYQISETETRCLVDLPPTAAQGGDAALAGYLEGTVAPQLPLALRKPFLAALEEQPELMRMPCKALARGSSGGIQGCVSLGDAACMRHALTGSGMTAALQDVEALVACLAVGGGGCAAFARAAQRSSMTLSVLANALHAVFTTPEGAGEGGGGSARAELRDACLAYLARGGACAAGPIGLLAGLSPSPLVLLLHFFAVALLAGWRGFGAGCCIILPILSRELAWGGGKAGL